MKDEEQGQDEPSLEAFASGAAQEVAELRVKARWWLVAEPVAEGSSWNTLLSGILALGAAFWIVGVVEGSGGVTARPAERDCAWLLRIRRLSRSHGSGPVVGCGKATVGKRAMLV